MHIDLSENQGKLLKVITKAGVNSCKPFENCKVKAHYNRFDARGVIVESSRVNEQPFEFVLGNGSVIRGWDIGVASMELGERADFEIDAELAYGNETMKFDIELLGWTFPDISKKQDGTLFHRETKEGSGESTQGPFVTVTCNYSLYTSEHDLTPSIEVDRDSRFAEKELVETVHDFQFTFGEEQAHPLFERLIGIMTIGGESTFVIKSGCSELAVPDDKLYEYMLHSDKFKHVVKKHDENSAQYIQLDICVTNVERQRSEKSFLPEEKLSYCEKIKEEGNQFFRQKRYGLALRRYNRVINVVEGCDNSSLDSTELKALKDIQIVSYTNIATVYFNQNNHLQAEFSCMAALEIDPDNVKALLKRAQIHYLRQDYDKAVNDLQHALSVDPENKLAKQELQKSLQKLSNEKSQQKQLYQRMFDSN